MSEKITKMLQIAYDLANESHYIDALQQYDDILYLDSQNLYALVDKGVTLQNMGKNKDALKYFEHALSIDPENTSALINKGSVLHILKKYSDAIACYDAALKIEKSAMALAYKGLSLGESGKIKESIIYFKKALDLDSTFDLPSISLDTARRLSKRV